MYNTAIKILKKIEDEGFKAYIVGGYPRDLYLNRDCVDIDICTNATSKDLKNIFKDAIVSKFQYGSVTIFLNSIRFEITTFRKDIKYEDNRLPVKIKYIDSLLEDLQRRDFIINTLCINSNGDIIDLLDAKKDLDNKIIKVVGNSKHKLKEDSLRILRAIRFATVLDFELDNNLKKSIKKNSYLLEKLSFYRKKDELDKILSSSNFNYGISLIKELDLEKPLAIKIDNLVKTDLIGMWAQLGALENYQFTKNEKDQIIKINKLLELDLLDNKVLYKYGLYLCCIAGDIKKIDRKKIYNKFELLQIADPSEIKVASAKICQALNKKPGSFLKNIYSDIEDKIVNNNLNNNEDDIINYIKNNYN